MGQYKMRRQAGTLAFELLLLYIIPSRGRNNKQVINALNRSAGYVFRNTPTVMPFGLKQCRPRPSVDYARWKHVYIFSVFPAATVVVRDIKGPGSLRQYWKIVREFTSGVHYLKSNPCMESRFMVPLTRFFSSCLWVVMQRRRDSNDLAIILSTIVIGINKINGKTDAFFLEMRWTVSL